MVCRCLLYYSIWHLGPGNPSQHMGMLGLIVESSCVLNGHISIAGKTTLPSDLQNAHRMAHCACYFELSSVHCTEKVPPVTSSEQVLYCLFLILAKKLLWLATNRACFSAQFSQWKDFKELCMGPPVWVNWTDW